MSKEEKCQALKTFLVDSGLAEYHEATHDYEDNEYVIVESARLDMVNKDLFYQLVGELSVTVSEFERYTQTEFIP